MVTTMLNSNGLLTTSEHINYFYGMLLDVNQLRKEHNYHDGKRRLLNRLILGSGVVCGLSVVAADLNIYSVMHLQPGVAIDALGREIVVPAPVPFDPSQLTDAKGTPVGDPVTGGTVEICLSYRESLVDPMPVLVRDCDTPGDCAPSTVRETFCIVVREPEANPPQPPACDLDDWFLPVNVSLHNQLCELISDGCSEQSGDSCVILARVDIDNQHIDNCRGRSLIYNNQRVYELIMCLAKRMERFAGTHNLLYGSGDGQTAEIKHSLPLPLAVKLVDGVGNPVEGVLVQFTTDDGSVKSTPIKTDHRGIAQSKWKLGSKPGEQLAMASAMGSALTVTFRAKAVSSP